MLSMRTSVDEAGVGAHDRGADVVRMGNGWILLRRRLPHLPLAIFHPRFSDLLPCPGKRGQKAPQIAQVAHMFSGLPRQLRHPTSGYVSTQPTPQKNF